MVAEYLLQNSIWWAETSGLDGYRLDTFPYVPRKLVDSDGVYRDHPESDDDRRSLSSGSTLGSCYCFWGGQKRSDGIDLN